MWADFMSRFANLGQIEDTCNVQAVPAREQPNQWFERFEGEEEEEKSHVPRANDGERRMSKLETGDKFE